MFTERQAETCVRSEMSTVNRSTYGRSRYTRTTAWWKPEDRSNRNDPEAPETGNAVIQAPGGGNTTDNFRFTEADRKWIQNEAPRYAERNLTRCVRSCRRAKSLDEDSDNDEGSGLHSINDSGNRTNSEKYNSARSESSEEVVTTPTVDHDRERRTLKRSRSRGRISQKEDPLFVGRNAAERFAIDDLLSLDSEEVQSMEVDSDLNVHQETCKFFIRHVYLAPSLVRSAEI